MTVVGADVQALTSAAQQLHAAADELEGHSSSLTSILGGVPWVGSIAARFLSAWSGQHRTSMSSTAAFFREAAAKLDVNAKEQHDASAVHAAGNPAGTGLAPAGGPSRVSATPAGKHSARIVEVAKGYAPGSYGDQCKVFVTKVIREATGGTVDVSGGYIKAYERAGGTQVDIGSAQPGDIIQITPAGSTDSNAEARAFTNGRYVGPLHTAVIVGVNSDGTFEVVDSNSSFAAKEQVQHHRYDPSSKGGDVRIWRF